MEWIILRTLGAVIVLGVCAWALYRYAPASMSRWGVRGAGVPARMQRLDTLPLGPKRQLILVSIDETVVALGLHEHGMTVVYQGPPPTASTGAEMAETTAPGTIGDWLAQQGGSDAH